MVNFEYILCSNLILSMIGLSIVLFSPSLRKIQIGYNISMCSLWVGFYLAVASVIVILCGENQYLVRPIETSTGRVAIVNGHKIKIPKDNQLDEVTVCAIERSVMGIRFDLFRVEPQKEFSPK